MKSVVQSISIHYNRKAPKTKTTDFLEPEKSKCRKNEFSTDWQSITTDFVGTFQFLKIVITTEKTKIGCIFYPFLQPKSENRFRNIFDSKAYYD